MPAQLSPPIKTVLVVTEISKTRGISRNAMQEFRTDLKSNMNFCQVPASGPIIATQAQMRAKPARSGEIGSPPVIGVET